MIKQKIKNDKKKIIRINLNNKINIYNNNNNNNI
jgi:hypothetical protein